MEQTLTIAEVAKLLKMSYGYVFSKRKLWGFFQMEGSRVWRVFESDLAKYRKKSQNVSRQDTQYGVVTIFA
ncbi:hypothetical protein [Rodentibacter myodis]|uniref:DNA-binding protein n=1 Tax=Rodentibacter myodis TaxID=1907939 RepID=A0A1V3JSD0_9PAST|nr:hypothetical protein [Rodentibacter myodis]OOF59328.1 hypothetical protein BKL49_04440 [Rodentibacter myodis]